MFAGRHETFDISYCIVSESAFGDIGNPRVSTYGYGLSTGVPHGNPHPYPSGYGYANPHGLSIPVPFPRLDQVDSPYATAGQ